MPAVAGRVATTVQVPSVNTGKQLPQTARHSFTAITNVELFRGFQIGGSAVYQGRRYGGYADNRSATQTAAGVVTVTLATKVLYRSVPDCWRFDARASYALSRNLGSFHEDGWATPVDLLAAAQCYQRAAHGGDFRGCFNHACMLVRRGRVTEALPWIEPTGALGHARFRGQVRDWLEEQDDAELRLRGVAALDRGAARR